MLKTYYGLADCFGIESFICEDDYTQRDMMSALNGEKGDGKKALSSLVNMLVIRARANYQRHPAVYTAKLSNVHASKVKDLLDADNRIDALLYLKKNAAEIGIAKGDPFFKKHWESIPNPKLDPFG